MKRTFSLKQILFLTLAIALLIPYAISGLRQQHPIEPFQFLDIELERALRKTDPNILVLGSAASGSSFSRCEVDNSLFIVTDVDSETLLFATVLQIIEKMIETDEWSIAKSAGTNDSHWLRLEKDNTICIMQIWLASLTKEDRNRLLHIDGNRFVVKTSLAGFRSPD